MISRIGAQLTPTSHRKHFWGPLDSSCTSMTCGLPSQPTSTWMTVLYGRYAMRVPQQPAPARNWRSSALVCRESHVGEMWQNQGAASVFRLQYTSPTTQYHRWQANTESAYTGRDSQLRPNLGCAHLGTFTPRPARDGTSSVCCVQQECRAFTLCVSTRHLSGHCWSMPAASGTPVSPAHDPRSWKGCRGGHLRCISWLFLQWSVAAVKAAHTVWPPRETRQTLLSSHRPTPLSLAQIYQL